MSPNPPAAAVSRRGFLRRVGASALWVGAPALIASRAADAALDAGSELFALGVASGDPSNRSVVLWTRLAPDPLTGGGLPDEPIPVTWEVATDPDMSRILRRGSQLALPSNGHAVHAVARGLPADRWLYYRFRALGTYSRIGRTRTFPDPQPRTEQMRFAVASCQSYNQGFYTAYADMLTQELDFVVHLGDYIYEGGPTSTPIAEGRTHRGGELRTLADYRNRYALYRLDPNLQAAHAWLPFIVTPDDHEIDNNYVGLTPHEASSTQGEAFAARRRIAYQAYAEHTPLRAEHRFDPRFGRMQLFRRLRFGDLADLHVLDTRQYRTDQPAGDGFGSTDPRSRALEGIIADRLYDAEGILDPSATVLGARQEAWLEQGLRRSRARWNVIAQQIMVMRWNLIGALRRRVEQRQSIDPERKPELLAAIDSVDNLYNLDAWDGYPAARERLFRVLAEVRPANPVILSGDIHSAWAAHLLADFDASGATEPLAVELVTTSIASAFFRMDPRGSDDQVRHSLVDNPHIRYFNGLFRGYLHCQVERDRWETSYRAVGDLADIDSPDPLALVPYADSPVETDAVFSIAAGFNQPGSPARLQGWSRLTPDGPLQSG